MTDSAIGTGLKGALTDPPAKVAAPTLPPENDLLPCWFTEAMMSSPGLYGLMTTTGLIMMISFIDKIREDAQGDLWLDVQLVSNKTLSIRENVWGAPGKTLKATLNCRQIVAAFNLTE